MLWQVCLTAVEEQLWQTDEILVSRLFNNIFVEQNLVFYKQARLKSYLLIMRKIFVLFFSLIGMTFASEIPTDLDSLFQGNEYKIQLHDSLRHAQKQSEAPQKADAKQEKSKSWFVLQFEALADFDAAQRRRDQLVASTGYAIQIVFDTPFYKLRAGGFPTKAAAEDKARELSAYNISAFVVKVR